MEILREFRWHPEIGDPTVIGWLTVVAYAVAAVLALRVWHLKGGLTWLLVALVLLALGVNKQMDLQSLFTDIGRVASHHLGWYEQRRNVQKWFILGVVGTAGISGAWFVWRHHAFWSCHKLLTAGVLTLMTFVIVRAVSFYHFEKILAALHVGEKMNLTMELGGIFMILLAAWREPGKSK